MMFTEFEKSLINTIVSQNTGTIRHFGYNGRNILFPTNEGAVFIPRDTFWGGRYTSILFLLAYHDGGRTHAELHFGEEHWSMSVRHAWVGNDDLMWLTETHNTASGVQGSRRITEQIGKMPQIAETKIVSAIFIMPLSGRIVNVVRCGGVQFVNSLRREQFCSRFKSRICKPLSFCVFLRFPVLKAGYYSTLPNPIHVISYLY